MSTDAHAWQYDPCLECQRPNLCHTCKLTASVREYERVRSKLASDNADMLDKEYIELFDERTVVVAHLCTAFNRYGVVTVGDVVSKTPDDLRHMKGIGLRSLLAIRRILAQRGLRLRNDMWKEKS